MHRMRTEPFIFTSGGDRLAGVLYLPAEQPVAAVVTTGPLTSVKEQATGAYARALAERRFAALAFDHRTFGDSEGEPRQFEDPEGKADDVRAAVTALGADERTRHLPIVAVGICAGAGYMARAVADDPRICAFAGVAGYYSDAASLCGVSPDAYQAAIARGLAAERRWRETGEVKTIPAVAPERRDVAMHCASRTSSTARREAQLRTTSTGSAVSRWRTRHRSTRRKWRPALGCRSSCPSEHARPPRWPKFYPRGYPQRNFG